MSIGKEFVVFQWLASLVIAGLLVWLIVEIIKDRKEQLRMADKLHDFAWARQEMMNGHYMKCEDDTVYFIKYGDLWSKDEDCEGKLANIGIKEFFSTKWEYADDVIKTKELPFEVTQACDFEYNGHHYQFRQGTLYEMDGYSEDEWVDILMQGSNQFDTEEEAVAYCKAYIDGFRYGLIHRKQDLCEKLTAFVNEYKYE